MVLKPNAVVDIAKQGLQLQNLTGMWNARVLDGFTPFVVQFKENGLPVNLTDLNAFIEGDIGEGHYDSATDDIVMTGTPKSVRYTDDGSGNTNMGIVVFRLPPQFFIQTGIFKGFIGLQSSTGIRSTSNDVWFKVLGNSYTMGISCKYFISDFQKALDQADGKITQALNDLYNKYNQKAGQAESNLDNFLSTLKNEQKAADDLSMLIKQTNDYINTHNVVTRNEYDKLANEIVTKLGQINVTPNYYKNYDDMVANNPNGTENLCVTADTEHKWLYVNKQWLDLGNFSYAAIDPQLKMAMLTPNTSNVLPNSDFKLDDYWSAASSDGKEYTLENVIERFKSYNGSYYFKVFGDSTDAKVARWLLSSNFSVNGNAYMSIGLKGAVNSDGTNAYIVVHFIDKDKNEISQGTFLLDNSSAFKYFKFENIAIPANTVYISIGFVCKGTGIIEGTQPQINFDKVLLPYDSKDTVNQIDETYTKIENEITSLPNDNFLPNADLKTDNHWTVGSSESKISINDVIDSSKSYINSYYFKISGDGVGSTAYKWLISENLSITEIHIISVGVKAMVSGSENQRGAFVHLDIHCLKADGTDSQLTYSFTNSDKIKYYKFENIFLPDETTKIAIGFTVQGTGSIEGTQPQISFSEKLPPYSANDVSEKIDRYAQPINNALPNSDFKLDDYWSAASSDGKEYTLENVIERFKSYNGSYYFKVFGDSTDAKVARWLLSSNFSVNGNAYMSIGLKGAVNSDGTNAYIVVHFIDKDKNEISQGTFLLDNSSAFKYFKFENIAIPANTVYISIGFVCKGTGIIEGTQPQVSFTKVLLPYSIADKTTNKLPQLRIYVDDVISSDWTNSRFTYVDGNKDLAGFVQIAWQGDSSKSYPKKNYKTKFFEDADFKKKMNWKPKASWANNNKFNLKANWIDATHARNLMNAKLFAKATAVTPFANADIAKKLSASQNFGQMEGFPIEVYINNDYQGLYTLNTKKDEKTFNMSDKIAGEEALEFENPLGADLTIDEKNVSTIVQDKPNDELQNNFTKFVKFINDSSDDDFKAHLQDYIDVKSVMNQYLFGVLAQEWDYYSKSYLLLTYNNGKYWYLTQYDLDSTWDIYWNGTQDPRETSFDLSAKELSGFVTGGSTLYSRVYKLFKQELQEQYKYLRSTVWRNDELIKPFKEFIDSIPSEVYKHDQTIWTNIPSKDFTSYGQLQSTILRRASEMDQFVNNTFEPIDTK